MVEFPVQPGVIGEPHEHQIGGVDVAADAEGVNELPTWTDVGHAPVFRHTFPGRDRADRQASGVVSHLADSLGSQHPAEASIELAGDIADGPTETVCYLGCRGVLAAGAPHEVNCLSLLALPQPFVLLEFATLMVEKVVAPDVPLGFVGELEALEVELVEQRGEAEHDRCRRGPVPDIRPGRRSPGRMPREPDEATDDAADGKCHGDDDYLPLGHGPNVTTLGSRTTFNVNVSSAEFLIKDVLANHVGAARSAGQDTSAA
jgi:hypothetical protein